MRSRYSGHQRLVAQIQSVLLALEIGESLVFAAVLSGSAVIQVITADAVRNARERRVMSGSIHCFTPLDVVRIWVSMCEQWTPFFERYCPDDTLCNELHLLSYRP